MSADIFTNDKMELTVQERQNLRDENYAKSECAPE